MRMYYLYNSSNVHKNREVATKFSGKSTLNCFPKRLFRKPKVGVVEVFPFLFWQWLVYLYNEVREVIFFHILFWKTPAQPAVGGGHYTQLVKAATYQHMEERVRISYSLADQNERLPSLKMGDLRVTHAVLSIALPSAPELCWTQGSGKLREAQGSGLLLVSIVLTLFKKCSSRLLTTRHDTASSLTPEFPSRSARCAVIHRYKSVFLLPHQLLQCRSCVCSSLCPQHAVQCLDTQLMLKKCWWNE